MAEKLSASQPEIVMGFLERKSKIFQWLDQGIVVKAEWDNILREAEQLGMEASKHQILRYYEHYRIAELGTL